MSEDNGKQVPGEEQKKRDLTTPVLASLIFWVIQQASTAIFQWIQPEKRIKIMAGVVFLIIFIVAGIACKKKKVSIGKAILMAASFGGLLGICMTCKIVLEFMYTNTNLLLLILLVLVLFILLIIFYGVKSGKTKSAFQLLTIAFLVLSLTILSIQITHNRVPNVINDTYEAAEKTLKNNHINVQLEDGINITDEHKNWNVTAQNPVEGDILFIFTPVKLTISEPIKTSEVGTDTNGDTEGATNTAGDATSKGKTIEYVTSGSTFDANAAPPTASPESIPEPTSTSTPTPTPTPTSTPKPTSTPSPTPTPTTTPKITSTPTIAPTKTTTITPKPTSTPVLTPPETSIPTIPPVYALFEEKDAIFEPSTGRYLARFGPGEEYLEAGGYETNKCRDIKVLYRKDGWILVSLYYKSVNQRRWVYFKDTCIDTAVRKTVEQIYESMTAYPRTITKTISPYWAPINDNKQKHDTYVLTKGTKVETYFTDNDGKFAFAEFAVDKNGKKVRMWIPLDCLEIENE